MRPQIEEKDQQVLDELIDIESRVSLLKAKILRDEDIDPVLRFNLCQMAGGWTQFIGHVAMRVHGLTPESGMEEPLQPE